jgi:hypothetical protein
VHEESSELGFLHSVNPQGLEAAGLAMDDFDGRFRQSEVFRHEGDDGGVGFSLFRGRGYTDLENSIVLAKDAVCRSLGLNLDRKKQLLSRAFDINHLVELKSIRRELSSSPETLSGPKYDAGSLSGGELRISLDKVASRSFA